MEKEEIKHLESKYFLDDSFSKEEICECGHTKNQHNLNTNTGEYTYCSEVYNKKNKCLCKEFKLKKQIKENGKKN